MTAPTAKATLQQLRIRRTYDAPRELMFRLWTEPEHIRRWWAPRGFTVPYAEFDARPGGRLRIDYRAPDGFAFPNYGEVKEVSPFGRLVFTTEYREGGKLLVTLLHTVLFAEHGAQTDIDLLVTVTFAEPEAAESLAHLEQGTNEQMDKLEELVATLKGETA